MDTTKIKVDVSWKESVSITDDLKDTLSWYLTKQPALLQDQARIHVLIYDARSLIRGHFVKYL